MSTDLVIARLGSALAALGEAKTIQDTKAVLDVAAAAEIYAKRQKLSEENIAFAHDVKTEALRQLGELLSKAPKNTGAAGIGPIAVTNGNRNSPPTLADQGIDKRTSAVAQQLAALPKEKFAQVKAGKITLSKARAAEKPPKASAQKPETSKSSTGSTVDPSASLAPDDTFEGDDPLDQLEATLKENETLRKTVEKLSATDQGAALAKALAAQAYAEDQQGKAMNQAAMYQKEVKAWQSWWAKVVVMVHIEKRSDLLGWIKARL